MRRSDFATNKKRAKIQWPSDNLPIGNTFIGVDWGDGHEETVVCMLTRMPDGQIDIRYQYLGHDIAQQVNLIEGIIHNTNSKSVVGDIGAGQAQIQMLQRRYGNMVKSCYYRAGNSNRMSYNADTWMLSVNRDEFLAESTPLAQRPMTDNERHALNYAYIASTVVQ